MTKHRQSTPAWLDATGKAAFKKLKTLLQVTEQNKQQVAILADTLSEYRKATKQLQAEGLTVTSASGSMKAHPAVMIKAKARADIMRLLKVLMPDTTEQTEGTDPLEDLLS